MTRKDILEKRRADFYEWCEREGYNPNTYLALESWNAALESVVIELPPAPKLTMGRKIYTREQYSYLQGIIDCEHEINEQGFRTK